MLFTIRNRDHALALAARASTADLKTGMVVVFVQGGASGDQPQVRKATGAELADATVQKGIVWYRAKEDDADIDFTWDPATNSMTVKAAALIPLNAQVTVLTGKVIVAYHKSLLPAGLLPGTVRETAKIAFDSATNFPGVYNAGGANGLQIAVGSVFRIDGPEVTMVVVL